MLFNNFISNYAPDEKNDNNRERQPSQKSFKRNTNLQQSNSDPPPQKKKIEVASCVYGEWASSAHRSTRSVLFVEMETKPENVIHCICDLFKSQIWLNFCLVIAL